jgi:RNA polymerase sigma-54 factor
VARPESLNDYLRHQLGELELEAAVVAMAERIISALDARDGGYLKSRLEDLLPPDATPDDLALARQALDIVQRLDPPGIAARDLRECLLAQLTPDMPYYEELRTLISGHLEDLRDNRLPQIQRKTGYTIERIQKAWEQLRKLNPKPGAQFAETFIPTVVPDVTVEQAEDGSYRVVLDEARTPRLYISEYYRQRLLSGQATPEEREFIKRKINAAQWLIDSIEQRRGTLTRVTGSWTTGPSSSSLSRCSRLPTRSACTSRPSAGPWTTSGFRRRAACSPSNGSSSAARAATKGMTWRGISSVSSCRN